MASTSEQRRAAHAALTKSAILDAARALFIEQGYFATTIDQVARAADMSPATVYAVAGGKQGLINALLQQWADSPILRESAEQLPTMTDPRAIIALVAQSSRRVREQHGDVMRILLVTAPHDVAVAEGLAASTARYRGALVSVADRLQQLGALAVSAADAADTLWFYFGYAGYFTLTLDNGWTFDRSQAWLFERCCEALLSA